MRFWSFLFLGMLAFGLAKVNEAQAAPAWQASSAIAASTGADVTVTLPTHAAGDILLLQVIVRDVNDTITWPSGWTQLATVDRGTTARYWWAWKRAASSAETNPLVDKNTTTGDTYAAVTTYRGALAASDPWDVIGTPNTSTTAAHVLNGVTTATADSLIIASVSGEDNSAASTTYSATDPTSLTQRLYDESVTGSDGACAAGAGAKAATGATGNVTATWSATVVGSGGIVLALKPDITTTLGNGTDPANAALAPGGAATMADAFTFQTSSGTDTITAVVVGLGTGASAGLSLVEITNDAGSTVYGSTADPASDTPTVTLSTNTLTATTTSTQYKIRITPKSHAAMPVPPGSTYSVTAKINSWTGTNTAKVGTDTAGTTVTIDNLSPANVTAASGTAGDAQVTLSWTNPADADFHSTVVLRDTSTVADTPVEGTTYTVGNTIGTSVVRCVVASPTATCTDTGVTNGTAYHYKIFTRDTNANYSATGVVPTGSPFTPSGPGCYSVATGDWNATATWADSPGGTAGTCIGPGFLPSANEAVYVERAYTVTVPTGYSAAAALVTINIPTTNATSVLAVAGTGSLTVGGSITLGNPSGQKKAELSIGTGTVTAGSISASGGGSVTFTGAGTLNVSGNFAGGGTYTAGTGTVVYNGSGAQTVGAYNYYNLTINKSAGTATTGGNITIGNNLTLTTGTLNIGANSIDRGAAGGAFTLSSGALLQIAAANLPANYSTVSIAATSTVEYNPSFNMTVPDPGGGQSYGNLLLSNSGNRTFNAAITIAGNLTATGTVAAVMNAGITVNGNVDLGASTSFDPKAYTHTFKGNYTHNGSTVSDATNTSTIVMNGTSAQAISGTGLWFYHLTANNSAGVTANSSFTIAGNFTNTAGFSAGATTTTFGGTAAQSITGATTFYGLVFNNAAGFTLNNDITASNALTLTSGVIATGTNTLIFSPTTSCSVTRTSGYVNGKLRKNFTASVTTCDFEIGDSTNYTPVTAALTSVTAGSVTASTTGTDHPQISASGIDSTASVNRYWTLVPAGGLAFTNANLTFTYIGGAPVDNDNTADAASYIAQRYDAASATWYGTNKTSSSSTSMVCYGPTTFGTTSYSDFAIGKPAASADTSGREREFIFSRELYY